MSIFANEGGPLVPMPLLFALARFRERVKLEAANHFAKTHTRSAEHADARLVPRPIGRLPQFSRSLAIGDNQSIKRWTVAAGNDRDG